MSDAKTNQESRKRVLTLEVEGGGRTFDFSNQELKMTAEEEPLIKLHFLRLGKLLNDPKESHLQALMEVENDDFPKNEDGCVQFQEVIVTDPKLENFSTVRTGLNPGYLYIIDENQPNRPIEFEVGEYGNFESVSWDKGGEGFPDIREKDGKNNTNGYYEAEFEAVVWAAYSTVQWSKNYYDGLVADTKKRKERMTKINASGFPLKSFESIEDFYPYTGLITYFSADKERLCKGIQRKINAVQGQEEKRQENRDKSSDNKEPLVMTDMFVTLEDPIGDAIEINEGLSEKILDFKAVVDAIQTGEKIEKAYNRLLQANLEAPAPKKEYQSLISLALTCYLMVYNDDDSIIAYDGGSPGLNHFDRYSLDPRPKTRTFQGKYTSHTVPNTSTIGYGLDYKKLEGILGIKERTALRETIQAFKKDFGTFLQKKYFKKVLDDYTDNLTERTIEGRGLVLEIIDPITINSYDFDRHMLLKKDYKKSDEWIDWVYRLIDEDFENEFSNTEVTSKTPKYNGLDPLYALLTPALNLDKVVEKGGKISHKLAKVYRKKLKHHSRQAFVMKKVGHTMFKEIADKQEFIVKKLNNNLTVFDERMIHVEDGELRMRLHELGVEIDDEYIGQSNDVRVKGKKNYTGKKGNLLKRKPGFKNTKMETEVLRSIYGSEGIEIIESIEEGGSQNKIGLKVRKQINANQVKANAKNIKFAQIVNGRAFNGVFAFIEFINLSVAFDKVRNESNWENRFNFAGASVKMAEAARNMQKAILTHKGAEKNLITSVSRKANRLSVIGGAFTAGMCFWESIEAMDKGDMDSGLALAGAGAAFAVSTAAPYIFASASVAGPVGWIAAGIGVGLLILAALLTDSELEEVFRNFLLSDNKGFPKGSAMTPMAYSRLILKEKKYLVDDDYTETLMNPADAEASLFDAIVCKNITFTPIDPKIEGQGYNPFTNPGGIKTHTVSSYKVEMSFVRFFTNEDQIETEILFYPNGLKHGNPYPIKPEDGSLCKITDDKGKESLRLRFSITGAPKALIDNKSEVLFALRLKIDPAANLYFPYKLKGEERYLGAKIKLKGQRFMLSDMIQNEDVRYAPLDELKNPGTW